MAEPNTGSEGSSRFVRESREKRDSNSPERRRSKKKSKGRGSILSSLHQAGLALAGAHVDAMSKMLNSYRDRHEDRRATADDHWIFGVRENLTEAFWDGYDHFTEVPKVVRKAYRNEADSADDS